MSSETSQIPSAFSSLNWDLPSSFGKFKLFPFTAPILKELRRPKTDRLTSAREFGTPKPSSIEKAC